MANSDKNILITPSVNASAEPTIRFTGFSASSINLRVLDDASLSFEGTAGQLFSISDGLSGTIFSVNDISGIPSIEVIDTGEVRIAQYSGNVGVGTIASSAKFTVLGSASIVGNVTASSFTGTLFGNATSASSINWAGVTGRPTTLSGYGITDAIPVSASQSYLTRSDAVVIYAPLASASFTGTPIAPTAASGTNTQQIATTQFVRTEVSNLIGSAPATLDTLNELAAALGNDPNFATSTASAIGQRLLASTASTLYMSIGSTANHATSASSINASLITGTTLPAAIVNSSLTNVGTLGSLTVSGNLTVDTDTLFIDSINNRVGIRTTSPSATLHVNATSTTAPSLTWGANSGQILRNENSELAIGLSNSNPFPLYFQGRTNTNTSRQIVLQPLGGNVGIGGDPSRTFTVVGTASFTGDISAPTHSGLLLGNAMTASSIAGSLVTGIVNNANHTNSASSINWAGVTAKPTLVTSVTAGTNGITIAGTATDPTISLNAGASVSWSNVSSKPSPIIGMNLTGNTTGAASATLSQLANGQISIVTNTAHASTASSIAGSLVTGTVANATNASHSNTASSIAGSLITGIVNNSNHANTASSINWSSITAKPTLVTSISGGNGVTIGGTTTDPTISLNSGASVSWGNVSSKPSPIIGMNLTGNTTGAASVTLSQLANGQISISTNTAHAGTASSIAGSLVTGSVANASNSTNATIATTLVSSDTRSASTTPETTGALMRLDFKQNTTENLSDGGTYFGELTIRPYGTGTDWSGGPAYQLGFTNNGNLWLRYGSSTTWGAWRKIWHDGNDGSSSGLDSDLLDGQNGSYYLDSNNFTNKPDPIIGVSLTGNTTGAASATLTDLTNGQISIITNTNFATSASSINWSGITGTPTLLTSVTGGTGITIGGTATNPTVSINAGASVSWGNVSSKPSPIIGVSLTGAVTGAASATLTQLVNGQVSITTAAADYLRSDTASTLYINKTISTTTSTSAIYRLELSDAGKIIEMNSASTNSILIPINASVAFPIGTKIDIIQVGVGATTASADTGVTLNSDTSKRTINTQWAAASLVKRATDTWVMIGALKA